MAIRIKCDIEGQETSWIDFRDHTYPFGDRRKMLEGGTDIESLTTILGYVEAWNLLDVNEKKITFDLEKGIDLFNNADELVVNWFIKAWFEARSEREQLPKKVS